MTGTAILLTADAGISSAFTTVFNKLGLHPIVLNEETAFFSLLSNISPFFICFDTYVCSNSPEQIMMSLRAGRSDLKSSASISFRSPRLNSFQNDHDLDILINRPSGPNTNDFYTSVSALYKRVFQTRVLSGLCFVREYYDLENSVHNSLENPKDQDESVVLKNIYSSMVYKDPYFIESYVNIMVTCAGLRTAASEALDKVDIKFNSVLMLIEQLENFDDQLLHFVSSFIAKKLPLMKIENDHQKKAMLKLFNYQKIDKKTRILACDKLVKTDDSHVYESILMSVLGVDKDFNYQIITSIITESDKSFLTGFIDFLEVSFQVSMPFNPINGRLKYKNQIAEFEEHMKNMLSDSQLLIIFSILQRYGAAYYPLFTDYYNKGDKYYKITFLKLLAHLEHREPLGWVLDQLEKEFDQDILVSLFYYMEKKGDARISLFVTSFLKEVTNYSDQVIYFACRALSRSDERAVIPIIGSMKSLDKFFWKGCVQSIESIVEKSEQARNMLVDFIKNPVAFNDKIRKAGYEHKHKTVKLSEQMLEALNCINIIGDARLPELIEKTLVYGNNIQRKTLSNNIKLMGRNMGIIREIIPLANMIESDDRKVHEVLISESKKLSQENSVLFGIREAVVFLFASKNFPEVTDFAIESLLSSDRDIKQEDLILIAGQSNNEKYSDFLCNYFVKGDDNIKTAVAKVFKKPAFFEGRSLLINTFYSLSENVRLEVLNTFKEVIEPLSVQLVSEHISRASMKEISLCLQILTRAGHPSLRIICLTYLNYPGDIRSAALDGLLKSFKTPHEFIISGFWDYFSGLLFSPVPNERIISLKAAQFIGKNIFFMAQRLSEHRLYEMNIKSFELLSSSLNESNLKNIIKINKNQNNLFEDAAAGFIKENGMNFKSGLIIENFPDKPGPLRTVFIQGLLKNFNTFEFNFILQNFKSLSMDEINIIRDYFENNDVEKFLTLFLSIKAVPGIEKSNFEGIFKVLDFCKLLGLEKFIGPMQKILKTNSKDLYEKVFSVLGSIDSPRAASMLVSNFSPMEKNYFPVIAEALINHGNENFIAPLVHKSKTMNSDYRSCILRILRSYGICNLKALIKTQADSREKETAQQLKKVISDIESFCIFSCRASL